MRALRWLLHAIEWAARGLVAALLVAMVVIVSSQFVDRYIHPVWGGVPADEYVKVALVWLTFVGFGLAMRAGVEIRVDFVDQRLPPRVRALINGFFDLLLIAMLGVIVYKCVRLYEVSSLQMILGTDMTVSIPVLGMLLGCVLMLIAVLGRLLRRSFGVEF